MLTPAGLGSGESEAFEWNLSMIAAGTGIPVPYFGTHISGSQTKAGAVTQLDPVTLKFEARQLVYENIIKDLWDYVMEMNGVEGAECEVTFPDLMKQDRSAKLQDLALAEGKWISRKRAASMASKEFGISDYDYDTEKKDIDKENSEGDFSLIEPLSLPGMEPTQPESPNEIKKAGKQ
jgi:hypothetical protein